MKTGFALATGALMGALMLGMAQEAVIEENSAIALISLAVLHLLAPAAIALVAVLFRDHLFDLAARPRRTHRPPRAHVAAVLGSATASATVIHILHGSPV